MGRIVFKSYIPDFATGVAGIVRDSGCGLLVDVTRPAAIAAAVAELGDPARRAALGEAGWHAARGAWGWEAEAARLVALYRPWMQPAALPKPSGRKATV